MEKKNILIAGTDAMKSSISGKNGFLMEEKYTYKTRGITPETRTMSAFCYGEITDINGNSLKDLQIIPSKGRMSVTILGNSPKRPITIKNFGILK
ncbi:MAG: hypothetical protein NT144_08985 [Bacteroidia bacterium]|nr:hypothetical protein [Bacteroidia bacterium]